MMITMNNNDATSFANVFIFLTSVGFYDVHFFKPAIRRNLLYSYYVYFSSLDGNSVLKMFHRAHAPRKSQNVLVISLLPLIWNQCIYSVDMDPARAVVWWCSLISSPKTFVCVPSLLVILRPGEGPKVRGLKRRHWGRKLENHPFIPLYPTAALCKMHCVFRGTAEQTRHTTQPLWKHRRLKEGLEF